MEGLILKEEKKEFHKNFRWEVRGLLDIGHLLDNAVVQLDIEETNYEQIFLSLVGEMATLSTDEVFDYTLIRHELFAFNNDGILERMRHRLHGYSIDNGELKLDQSWFTAFCAVDGVKHRHVGIARLPAPTNFGHDMEETQLLVLIIAPIREKGTKTAYETARTFSTLLADPDTRLELLRMTESDKLRSALTEAAESFSRVHPVPKDSECTTISMPQDTTYVESAKPPSYYVGRGIVEDFKRRWRHYKSDYMDGISDMRSIQKCVSTAVFLIFTILPTSIAYGMLNDENTHGAINVQKVILGQWIGGLFYGIVGGQELNILSTTAPLSIYIQVIYEICKSGGYDFYAMYATVGLWCQIFLFIYAIFEVANIMKYTKRSTEEVFGLFIAAALTYKAIRAVITSEWALFRANLQATWTIMRIVTRRRDWPANVHRHHAFCLSFSLPEHYGSPSRWPD